MAMPLEGIRVLDLSAFVYGPHTAAHLADMGAEVIKVEHPAGGDGARGLSAIRLLPVSELNYMFEQDNRNKKAITSDLSQEQGKEIIYKLLPTCDVFLTNFQAGVLKKLGMDYETLSEINPKLVYAYGSGWGLKGPEKDSPAFDYVAFARSGLMQGFSEPDTPPVSCLPGFGDHIAAMTLAYGIMLALFHRERTGEGQMVHASLLGSLVEATSLSVAACLATGQDLPKTSRKEAANPLWNYYECQDKKWLQFAMLQTDRHWPDLCRALGLESLEKDPRFDSHQKRCDNNKALISILDETLRTKPREEWVKLFRGRNIIWGYVQNFLEVTKDPQLLENDYIVPFQHPAAGSTKVVGIPVQLSKTPGQVRSAAPELSQHTEEILLELGYTWEDIAKLKDQKVIL